MNQQDVNRAIEKGLNRDKTRRNRNNKVKDFLLTNLLNKKWLYFFTFTFNDEHLPINQRAFKRYLQLNKLSYLLFYDEGAINERAHYHGFVALDYELNGDVLNRFGFTKYRPIYSSNGYECLTAQFYLSQKNFNDRIKRLMIHYSYDVPSHQWTLEEIRNKMKITSFDSSVYCLNMEEEILKFFRN